MTPRVIIFTGPMQSGKSTVLTILACLLGRKGYKLAGIIAQGLWQDNMRAGFDIMDLTDESITPLCRRTPDDKSIDGIPFSFSDAGVAAGIKALSPERCAGADFVIVDEVGPLELRGRGWGKCLDPLLELHGPVHIWVIRSGCLQQVRRKWGLSDAEIVTVGGPDALNRLLAACLRRQTG